MSEFQPTLYISLRSPFARRVRLAMHRLGLPVALKTVDVFQENPDLIAANPLGLVPTLITPTHGAISDSANILEYLHETTGKIHPADVNARIASRQTLVWVQGVMQSLVLYFQEAKLHEVPSPRWMKEHVDSMETTMAHLSSAPKSTWFTTDGSSGGLTQAAWDLCVTLEYMDLRIPELVWRKKFPQFIGILEQARKDSYFCETTPPA